MTQRPHDSRDRARERVRERAGGEGGDRGGANRASRSRSRNASRSSNANHPNRTPQVSMPGPVAALLAWMDANRTRVILVIFGALAALFFVRLFALQVVLAPEYTAMAEETRTISFTTTPRRGTIYDRNGVVLATSVEATTVYCNPSEVTDANYTAAEIARIMGGEAADYLTALTKDKSTFAYIKRQGDVEPAEQLKELKLPGIYFIEDTRREYPNGAIGGQVIGFCNVDGEGITGLELQYNDILEGTPGTYSAERGENGMPIPGGVREDTPAVDGQDIMVSLDIKLQDSVEQTLKADTEKIGAKVGTSVIMDAGSGEIFAVCSLPYMDPTNMSASEVGSDNLKPITQAFEPGSDYKTVAALAILESGAMTPDSTLYVPAELHADEYVITDSHERVGETMDLRRILAESSNIGISLATESVGFQTFYDAILRYKLNEKTGVDFPGESKPSVTDISKWSHVGSYNATFGQGLTATPLQMTRFYAMLANDGTQVTPHFLISLPQTGERPEYASEQIVTDQTALANINSMLRSVVTDGTGKAAGIDGFDVVGKTSTAQVARNGKYVGGLHNLCFVGYLDNSSSQLVCFVSANEVYSEASVAFIFHDIMANAVEQYNIVPE